MPSPKSQARSAATHSPSPRSRTWTTVEGAAGYLDCSVRTIRRMIARGEITGYRLGSARMIRIDVAELDDLAQPIPSAMIGQAS